MALRTLVICFLFGIGCTHVYGGIEEVNHISFDAIYEYSKLKLDSASLLLDRKGDSIDFDNYGDESAFEFFLAKADIHYHKRNFKALESLLETATDYNEASENEIQKTKFDYWTYLVDEYHTIGSRKNELEKLVLKADSIGRIDLYIDSKYALSRIYQNDGDIDTAITMLQDCLERAESHSLHFRNGFLLQHLGTIYFYELEQAKSEKAFEKATEIFEMLDFKSGIASILNTKGVMFRRKGYYKEALRNYHECLPILEEVNDYTTAAYVNNNIGLIYDLQKDYAGALKYFDNALHIFDTIGDVRFASYTITNLGVVHLNLREYDKAEEYLLKSIKDKKRLNETSALIFSYNKIGLLYLETGQYNKAKSVFQKAIRITEELATERYKAEALLGLSKVSQHFGGLDKAKEFALASLEITKNQGDLRDQLMATQQLADITQQNNNYYLSNQYLKESSILKDSILNIAKVKEIESLKFEFETNKNRLEQELNLQKAEAANLQKDAIISSNRKQLFMSGLLLLLSLGMIGLGLKNNISKRKTNAELSRVNSLLSVNNDKLKYKQEVLEDMNNNLINFAGTAAHDLKSPLRTIGSLNGLMSRKYKDVIKPDDQKILDIINNNIQSLSKMIEDLLVFSKIDQDLPPASKIELQDIIKSVELLLQSQIEEKNAAIIVHNTALVLGHKALLTVLFQNIIQNAVKFSAKERDPIIEIRCKVNSNKKVEVFISDNGIGLEKSSLDTIFKGFQKLHSQDEYEGTGIGLATCKKIVQYYNGQIKAESELGKGTTFSFILPSYI